MFMLSEPVEKMANPVATPEAGPPQDIPTHDICPQWTMRERKRTGLSDIDPFRIMTKTIICLYDGATAHAPSLIPGGCRLHHTEERGGLLGWIISNISGTHERPLVVSPRGLR
jgi:hypothetical protein